MIIIVILTALWQLQYSDIQTQILVGLLSGVVVVTIGGIIFWRYRKVQQKLRALDIAAIDTMDPLEFEVYVARLLRSQGFTSVRLTERYDYGVDIVAHKNGVTWGVQVKRYSNIVKAEAVRQVVTALIRYKCDRAIVVTNSTFSRPATELAADNKCVLIDRDQLADWIVQFWSEGANRS